MPRRPDRDDIFRDQRHFLAEPAADLRRDNAELGFRDPQDVGYPGAQQVWHLRRRREGDAPRCRIESGDCRARLQRHRKLPA